jgi:recombination protein RecR
MHTLDDFMARLSKLPGLGPRSAKRIALHLLKNKETHLKPFMEMCARVYDEVKSCATCFNLSDQNPCGICCDPKRSVHTTLCVVAEVGDVWALERTAAFKGHYHVLGGLLSAVDGMGPHKLHLVELKNRLEKGVYQEVLFALNATLDAQTTMHYIISQLQNLNLRFTALAKGVPLGGELDYLDDATLSIALHSRQDI